MRNLSNDFKGINDKDSEYCERVATFSSPEYADEFGELFAAAPEMLRALKNIVSSAPLIGLPLALEKDIQSACELITRLGEK